jgi:hypothetical protein
MCNAELWMLAEQNKIKQWSIFRDKENNEIIWTGKSFQANTEVDDKYTGMCLGDQWELIGIEEPEDEFSQYMNKPE